MTGDPAESVVSVMARRLQATVTLDGAFGEGLDASLALSSAAHLGGELPFAAERRLRTYVQPAVLLPDGVRVARSKVDGDNLGYTQLWEGDRWVAYVRMSALTGGSATTYATSPEVALSAVNAIVDRLPSPDDVPDDEVEVSFHYLGSSGVKTSTRRIQTPTWDEIRVNYPASVADSFDRLMALQEPTSGGKLLLLYGPPGTGKTTALQALARQWRAWCRVSYVLDAEHLFSSVDYLHSLILNEDTGQDDDDDDDPGVERLLAPRWRLIVIEDADEIIGARAREQAGQALSRLLNLTDGVVGKGLRTLVAITTNEPVTSLHKAVIRPGRCLAEINVEHLSPAECRAWLGDGFSGRFPSQPTSLAELYALRCPTGAVRSTARGDGAGIGQYL